MTQFVFGSTAHLLKVGWVRRAMKLLPTCLTDLPVTFWSQGFPGISAAKSFPTFHRKHAILMSTIPHLQLLMHFKLIHPTFQLPHMYMTHSLCEIPRATCLSLSFSDPGDPKMPLRGELPTEGHRDMRGEYSTGNGKLPSKADFIRLAGPRTPVNQLYHSPHMVLLQPNQF